MEPKIPKRKLKEYIVRLVHVEMLGHDSSFSYIHAVKMTHDEIVLLKRTGYLAVTLFLGEDHDLIILITSCRIPLRLVREWFNVSKFMLIERGQSSNNRCRTTKSHYFRKCRLCNIDQEAC